MKAPTYEGNTGLDILRTTLPKDLELHHMDLEPETGDSYDIRTKGCWLNFRRPYVTINYDAKGKLTKIYFHTKRSVPLAYRLSKIYPEAEVTTVYKDAYIEYSKLLEGSNH